MEDQLTIEMSGDNNFESGQIINASGKVILHSINFKKGKTTLDTSDLPTGVFLKLSGEGKSQVIKLLKQ